MHASRETRMSDVQLWLGRQLALSGDDNRGDVYYAATRVRAGDPVSRSYPTHTADLHQAVTAPGGC